MKYSIPYKQWDFYIFLFNVCIMSLLPKCETAQVFELVVVIRYQCCLFIIYKKYLDFLCV